MARHAMKGWGANLGADLRARKGALLGQIKCLDDLADGAGLSPDDWTRRYSLDAELMGIFRRKCVIPFLRDGDVLLESPEDISSHIYSFYKELFSADLRGSSSLSEDFWPLADQVSDVENAELTLPFSSEEVGQAIASMKACSAPGPDGLPVVFFQRFWETVRPVIMPMFHEFYIGTLNMGRNNYGVITLIPKLVGAAEIWQFRPITVINVVARIFAKVCATRLSPVAERIAHPLQSALLKGRKIHDGILALHEVVHEVASKGMKGVFLKLDFQKAYVRLDWSFLRLVLQRRGFDERWCSWIMQLVRSGSTAININAEVGPFFRASRGVKQGGPISPLLFNLAVDALASILDKARLAGHILGVVGHLIPGGGVSHLQYADDTMIMVSGSESDIANLKFLLLCFEEMSGLKINFDKSEVVVLGYSEVDQLRIVDNLNCKLATFPISYLGMPLAESRILVSGFDPLVGRVASRAEPWCGRFTSKCSKSILISSNLASLPMYMMGMYILPEGVHNAFDKELARFFWHAGDGRPKYHMVKWDDVCVPKDRGGLGIPASRRMNVALMLRWVWQILQGDGGLWLQLIEAKYLRGRPLLACSLANGSQFWKSIQSIKHEIRLGLRFSVGDGSGT
uniref:Reverse transcriptase domain-containing protein n=1 Tax=Hordeum vulgare subsp. vulgare TaxID=112509 RepID=A0A8I6X0D4_HORVV